MEQQHRQARISTALGEGALFLRAADVTEGLSRLTEIGFEAISDRDDIDPADLLGTNVTIGLNQPAGSVRHFNGYVTRFGFVGRHGRNTLYRGVAHPWMWFLTRSSNCRIFHEKSAVDIAKEIFQAHGMSDHEFRLNSSPPPYHYCVQYNESDHDFVCRLLEKEGIYYFVEHSNGGHNIVFADATSQHTPVPGYETFELLPPDDAARIRREGLRSWTAQLEVRPNSVALQDYDYEKPRADIGRSSSAGRSYAAGSFEVYTYPGEYTEPEVGGNYARIRAEELQTGGDVVVGEGNYRGLATGATFQMSGHAVGRFNARYLITGATHHIAADTFESGDTIGAEVYTNRFEAMPATETFRPPRVTPRPRIVGPQTAVVVGSGEIDADEYGSVLVRFPWARNGEDSCRVRVSQAWAGAGWGAMMIPRVGQEVIVEFLEGDPDRPIITGRVYNAKSMPAYNPESEPTTTTVKTSSSPGGSGANELRFDDKAGEERLFMNAWKDMETHVGNDRLATIGRDDHLEIGGSQFESVGMNWNRSVGVDAHFQAGSSLHSTVGTMMLTDVGANMITTVGMALKQKSTVMRLEAQHIELSAPIITLNGKMIYIGGGMVFINSGTAPAPVPDQKPKKPQKPGKVEQTTVGDIGKMVEAGVSQASKLATDTAVLAARLFAAAQSGAAAVAAPGGGGGASGGTGTDASGRHASPGGYAPAGGGSAPSRRGPLIQG